MLPLIDPGPLFEDERMMRYRQRMAAAPSARLEHVRAEIVRACRDAGRDPVEVTLIAVSKTFAPDEIESVIDAGQRVFGENRVQEAKAKWPTLLSKHESTELHLIGPLQLKKAKEAVALFDAIHSVDRVELVRGPCKGDWEAKPSADFVCRDQCRRRTAKGWVLPQDADAFLAACREKFGLKISGLMCIPPLDEAPGPHFALTGKIARRNGLKLLSMGMSADFLTAIALGATHIRVGTAIFGERAKYSSR